MRIRHAGLQSLAVTLLGVAALLPAFGADKIQFSPSSTEPTLVRPGRKIDDLIEGTSERSSKTEISVMPNSPSAPLLPNKAQLDKMSELLDRKKNWLIPGAMDNPDASNPFGKKDSSSKGFAVEDKKESVMERYMRDGEGKKSDENTTSRAERDRERHMKGGLDNSRDSRRDGNEQDEDTYDPSRKDQNGLAAFDLAGFLSRVQSGHQPELIKDAETLRGFQPKSDFSPTQDFRSDRERDQAREREATRSAEFMQMLKPRGGGIALTDPLNSPDRTGREMNPIAPRGYEPISRNSFSSPAGNAPRPQDSMFGVASPAALPSVTVDAPPIVTAPVYRPSQSILIAPPAKRVGD